MLSLDTLLSRGDGGGRAAASDFRVDSGEVTAGEVVDLPSEERKRLVLGENESIVDIGEDGSALPFDSLNIPSGHSKWRITFFVAH